MTGATQVDQKIEMLEFQELDVSMLNGRTLRKVDNAKDVLD